jgi:hypothetical protein
MKKSVKNTLIFALFLLALGGGMMHYYFHPAAKHSFGWVPLISACFSIFVIPLLFMFRKTIHWAYILNGFTVIIGIITMTHFSVDKSPIIPDILLVLAKLYIGRAIFCLEIFNMENEPFKPTLLQYIRYPHMGFWYLHLILLSLVYFLGNLLWR